MVIKTHYQEESAMKDPVQASLEEFSKLSLAVPLESTKYSFMSMFLDRVLNLANEADILNTSGFHATGTKTTEILPQIAVPPDLWTQNDITIKNIKVKNVMLKNANALLYPFLESLNNNELYLIDEKEILEFEKKVLDYKLLDFSQDSGPTFGSLKEDEEDEYDDTQLQVASPSTDISDSVSVTSAANKNSLSSKSAHRLSAFSRDIMGGRRKKSSLNSNVSKINTETDNHKDTDTPAHSPVLPSPGTPSSAPKGSQLNSLLSKSRIYKQIQKRRESGASVASSNSITSSSMHSQRHNSASYEPQESYSFSHRRSSQNIVSQKAENQKDKYEYYVQTRALADNIKSLVRYIGKSGSRANLKRVMEFIKNLIFKFIVVDVAHMIIQKGNSRTTMGEFTK